MSEAMVSFDKDKFAADARRLDAKLQTLAKKDARKAIRFGLRVGARFLAGKAQQAAPVGEDYYRKGVFHKGGTLSSKKFLARGGKVKKAGEISVLASTPKRQALGIAQSDKWYYPAIVEYGPKKGKHKWPGRQYMKRAFQSHGAQAIQVVLNESKEGIEKAMAAK